MRKCLEMKEKGRKISGNFQSNKKLLLFQYSSVLKLKMLNQRSHRNWFVHLSADIYSEKTKNSK